MALRSGFVAHRVLNVVCIESLADPRRQGVGLRARYVVPAQGRRADEDELLSPCVQQCSRLAKVALLARALPTRHQPVEALQLGQDLRGGGGRHHRLLCQLRDTEPVLMVNQQGVEHLGAPPCKQRAH